MQSFARRLQFLSSEARDIRLVDRRLGFAPLGDRTFTILHDLGREGL